MGKLNKANIKEFFKELKEESKNDSKKNKLKDQEYDEQTSKEIKEEIKEEKRSILISIGLILLTLIVLGLCLFLLYFCFHKKIVNMLDSFINSIPIADSNTSSDNNNSNITDGNNSNTDDNSNSNDNKKSNNDCSKAFDGTYKLGTEIITFVNDGYYDLSSNDVTTATGLYTIKNNVITVDATYEDFSLGSAIFTYNISKDCKTVTEVSTGKVFVRK